MDNCSFYYMLVCIRHHAPCYNNNFVVIAEHKIFIYMFQSTS